MRRSCPVAVEVLFSLIVAISVGCSARKPSRVADPSEIALVDSAQQVWVDLQKIWDEPDRVTMSSVELFGVASRRLCLAEMAAAVDDRARTRFVNEHRQRMVDVLRKLEMLRDEGGDVSIVEISQATYFIREAELWLAELSRQRAGVPSEEAKRLVESASDVVKFLNARREQDEASTPMFYHLICEASSRLCAAELIAADNRGERIAALERQRRRMRDEIDHYSGITEGAGWQQVRRATYELRVADVALARLEK